MQGPARFLVAAQVTNNYGGFIYDDKFKEKVIYAGDATQARDRYLNLPGSGKVRTGCIEGTHRVGVSRLNDMEFRS